MYCSLTRACLLDSSQSYANSRRTVTSVLCESCLFKVKTVRWLSYYSIQTRLKKWLKPVVGAHHPSYFARQSSHKTINVMRNVTHVCLSWAYTRHRWVALAAFDLTPDIEKTCQHNPYHGDQQLSMRVDEGILRVALHGRAIGARPSLWHIIWIIYLVNTLPFLPRVINWLIYYTVLWT